MGLEPTTSRLTAERCYQIELPRIDMGYLGFPSSRLTLSIWFGHFLYARLDQRVAIRTQQDALLRLSPHPSDAAGDSLMAEMELLRRRIHMMKLERGGMGCKPA